MAEYKDVEQLKKQIADFKRAVNSVKPMNSDYLTGYISALSVIEGEIAEQPTADVAPVRHGRWIKTANTWTHDYNEYGKPIYYCSLCGRYEKLKEPYCNCGAKMDEE